LGDHFIKSFVGNANVDEAIVDTSGLERRSSAPFASLVTRISGFAWSFFGSAPSL